MGREERVSAEVLAERALHAIRSVIKVILTTDDHTALPRFQWAERDVAEGLRMLEMGGSPNG